ncbi:expressed unknown protein [Seminavis robusta]|uniref:Uncharacterized protein n=1 Tax=Seminavis robusta TaxID=568900 RepID=A0A9N8EQU1_9STRA|nr:expressed unknown protein [Seminavis robusta]|eukprot:Sro1416_g270840.1 n/a (450) ;mRNA; r:13415-14764
MRTPPPRVGGENSLESDCEQEYSQADNAQDLTEQDPGQPGLFDNDSRDEEDNDNPLYIPEEEEGERVVQSAIPTCQERQRLQRLFLHGDWKSPTNARPLVQEARNRLKEFPLLARELFDADLGSLFSDEVLPITIFLSAGWLDWGTFDAVYKLFPECLDRWCDIDEDEDYPPWYSACKSEVVGLSKEIMTFLFTTGFGPSARTRAIGTKYLCDLYIHHALSKERSKTEYQTMVEILDILWADRTKWNTLLTEAVAANCDVFIEYILSNLQSEKLSFRFQPRRLDMRAAQGLEKVLPKLKMLDIPFFGGQIADEDACLHVVTALQGANLSVLALKNEDEDIIPEEGDAIERKASALEALMLNTRSLESLTVSRTQVSIFDDDPAVPVQYLDAVTTGVKHNQHNCITHLSLSNLDDLSIERVGALFRTGAPKIYPGSDYRPDSPAAVKRRR